MRTDSFAIVASIILIAFIALIFRTTYVHYKRQRETQREKHSIKTLDKKP